MDDGLSADEQPHSTGWSILSLNQIVPQIDWNECRVVDHDVANAAKLGRQSLQQNSLPWQ